MDPVAQDHDFGSAALFTTARTSQITEIELHRALAFIEKLGLHVTDAVLDLMDITMKQRTAYHEGILQAENTSSR